MIHLSVTDLKTFSIASVSVGSLELIELIPEISLITKLIFQIVVSTLTVIYLIRKIKNQNNVKNNDQI